MVDSEGASRAIKNTQCNNSYVRKLDDKLRRLLDLKYLLRELKPHSDVCLKMSKVTL